MSCSVLIVLTRYNNKRYKIDDIDHVTAVHEFEGGVMLCLDVSHKVLRTSTAQDLLSDMHKKDKADLEVNAQKVQHGSSALTSTVMDHYGEDRSFADHYMKHYGITFKDQKQPRLMSRAKKKTVQEADVTKLAGLVPELCNLTVLTESMKTGFKVMKDMGPNTNQRKQAMQKHLESSVGRAVASAHLLNGGLRLAKGPIRLEGRKLPPEKLKAGKNHQVAENAKADGTREITTNHCLNGVDLNKWVDVYMQKNSEVVKNFVKLRMKLAPKMGTKAAQMEPSNSRTETYVKGVWDSVELQVQQDGVIRHTHRDDRYPEAAVVKGISTDDNIRTSAESFSRPRTSSNFELAQDKIMTETTATGEIKTEGRTSRGYFEFGQDGFVIGANTWANRPQRSRSATIKYQAETRMTSQRGQGR